MDQDDVILKTDSRVNQGTTVIFDFLFVTTRDFQVLDISGPIPSLLVQVYNLPSAIVNGFGQGTCLVIGKVF